MRTLLRLIFVAHFLLPRAHAENTTHEFIMSCTYGVFAGTLVGAASLAFTSRPGEHLNKVARGASIGLYAGILLGFYVAFIVPKLDAAAADEVDGLGALAPPVFVQPTMGLNGAPDGLEADWTVYRF